MLSASASFINVAASFLVPSNCIFTIIFSLLARWAHQSQSNGLRLFNLIFALVGVSGAHPPRHLWNADYEYRVIMRGAWRILFLA